MKNKTNTISCHQTGVIASLLLLVLKLTSLPSLMYESGEIGGVVTIIIICIFNFLFVGLLVWLKKKFKNMNFYDIFSLFLGKIITKILYFVLFVFFILKLLSLVDDGFGFVRDIVDEEFTHLNFIICFFPVICAIAYSGIRNMARTCEFFFPFILIAMFVSLVFSFAPINIWGVGTISRLNFGYVARVLGKLSFWNGDWLTMLVFLDKIDLNKGKIKNIFSPLIIVSIFLILSYTLYFSLYQQTSILHSNMIFDIIEYSIGTASGWHMDIFAIIVYITCLFLQGAIYMFTATKSAEKVFNFHNKYIIYTSIVLLLIFIQFLYLNDYLKYVIFAQQYLHIFSSIIFLVYPLLILFAIIFKGRKNERTVKQN